MKKVSNLYTGISEPEVVNTFMSSLNHPLLAVVQYLRDVILDTEPTIGEGIYWNAPTFFYTGEMPDFDPKDYKRYLVGFVFNRQDCIRLVFLQGKTVENTEGVLEGDFKDGRKLAVFKNLEEAKSKTPALQNVLLQLINSLTQS